MLTAVARLEDGAYGVTIRQEIENATGRPCSLGALYTTLDRLETKGLIRTSMGDPTGLRRTSFAEPTDGHPWRRPQSDTSVL